MGLFGNALIVFLVAVALADDTCPPDTDLSPCTCDGEGVNCMAATTLDQMKTAFKSKFPYGGTRAIWIQGTPITSVPGDLFGTTRSQQFFIEINKISTVDMTAFNQSLDVMHTLSFFGNEITSFQYGSLSKYTSLRAFNLGRNKITSIPANAFDHMNLQQIILAQNQISSIGMYAFANLPNLQKLELTLNSLSTLGPMSFAFNSHSPGLQINLIANQINDVSFSAFNGANPQSLALSQNKLTSLSYLSFSSLVVRMANKRGVIDVTANPFTCKGCDYTWIMLNKAALTNTILGFRCPDGTGMQELTKFNIGC